MVAKPVYLYDGLPKDTETLKGGTNVTRATGSTSDAIMVIFPDVYTKTEVDNKLADKTDKSASNNSATAWSSGLSSDGHHYPNTGSDALVIRTPSCVISATCLECGRGY